MTPSDRHEQARRLSEIYRRACTREKSTILNAFCLSTGLNRKYAISLLRDPPEPRPSSGGKPRRRGRKYSASAIRTLEAIWESADFPWAVRLKALIPLWLAGARKRAKLTAAIESELLSMSPRTIDRYLQPIRTKVRRRIYGRTKPGTLLKHQIPIRTDRWNVSDPGWGEIDLVSHSGPSADGEFAHSMNFTDIHSAWVETRVVLGKGQTGILSALDNVRQTLPFLMRGLDSDNGSEFINHHVVRFCERHKIQFTRGRPYKKDDNAHVEQKNWTHVRRLVGWDRIDSAEAVEALDDLYRNEWRLMMNLFQPSARLVRKERIGSRVRRVYDAPTTPLDRLLKDKSESSAALEQLVALREKLDPFLLSERIQEKIDRVHQLQRRSQAAPAASRSLKPRHERVHPLLVPPPQGGGRPRPETPKHDQS